MNDGELLKQYAQSRSESAFAELVSRHVNLVYSTALRRVGEAHLAHDVAQMVFIELARKPRSVRDPRALAGWLYRATRHAAGNVLRTEMRRRQRESNAVQMSAADDDSHSVWQQLEPHLEEAIDGLSKVEQNAVVLRFFEGKALREVGHALSMTDDAAQKRISRALEKLRRHFAQRGVVASSTLVATTLAANSVHAAPAGVVTLLSGAALSSAATGLTRSSIETFLMSAKGKITMAAAAGIAVASAPIIWQHQSNARLHEQLTALREETTRVSASQTTAAPSAPAFAIPNWQALESRDYQQYIANLRAFGCPEQTIRDIIITDLDRVYGQRVAKLAPSPQDSRYWARQYPAVNTRREQEIKVIEDQKRAAIRELLGVDADEEAFHRTGIPVAYDQGFEFLSGEKRACLREIDREFKARLSAQGVQRAAWREQEWQAHLCDAWIWKDEAIKQALAPAEYEEYEVRCGYHAAGLRTTLSAFEPTEQEFRSILQIEKEFGRDKTYFDPRLGKVPDERFDPAAGRTVPPFDPATEEQFQKAVQEALGERYPDYQLSRDNNYAFLHEIVVDAGLPSESARAVYDLHKVAQQHVRALRQDSSLTEEARQTVIQGLWKETDEQVAKFLGEDGLRAYQWQFRGWMAQKMKNN